jgi:predicted ester cyclase
MSDTTTVEANKALLHRVFDEIVNGRNLDLLDELYREDMIDHDPLPGAPAGIPGVRHTLGSLQAAFSDLNVTIHDVSAHGDKVVLHNTWSGTQDGKLLGLPPTRKRVSYDGIVIFRVQDGLVAERWGLVDVDDLASQLDPTRRRRPRRARTSLAATSTPDRLLPTPAR